MKSILEPKLGSNTEIKVKYQLFPDCYRKKSLIVKLTCVQSTIYIRDSKKVEYACKGRIFVLISTDEI